jgi:hypothetical protein
MGRNEGITKNINFTKRSMKNFREHLMTEASQGDLHRVKEPYDAQIELYGAPFITPGQFIVVMPTVRGGVGIAKKLGLGGKYLIKSVNHVISPGQFNTSISATQEVMSSDLGKIKSKGASTTDASANDGTKPLDEPVKK